MKKVVVIGGGFAGATAAKKLKGKCDLTLIDTEDFFEYTPGILRVLVDPDHYKKLHVKHKDYLQGAEVVTGHVKEVDKKEVTLVDGRKIDYDYLVIASGSHYNNPIKEEDTFFATRVKHLLEANKKIKKSKKIYIVGAGLVGVELAAELATHAKGKVYLISSNDKIMERNNSKTQEYAIKFLQKNGVEIIFNERIKDSDKKKLISESGKKYMYDMAFFTVGIKPNTGFMQGKFSKFVPKGIEVNEFLQIPEMKNIFVAGDVTNIVEEKTAQTAEKHGSIVAQNILASIQGNELQQYKSKKRLMVISLGKNRGVLEYKGFVWRGWVPSVLKSIIEKTVMHGFR